MCIRDSQNTLIDGSAGVRNVVKLSGSDHRIEIIHAADHFMTGWVQDDIVLGGLKGLLDMRQRNRVQITADPVSYTHLSTILLKTSTHCSAAKMYTEAM